jgi:hypothetical protein
MNRGTSKDYQCRRSLVIKTEGRVLSPSPSPCPPLWERQTCCARGLAGIVGSIQRALRRAHQAEEFGADLVEAAFVSFAFLVEDGGNFGSRFEMRLSLLLDFDIDHFFQ